MTCPINQIQKETLSRNMVRDLLLQTTTIDLGSTWLIACPNDSSACLLIEMEATLREFTDAKYATIEIASPDRRYIFSTASVAQSGAKLGSLLEHHEINAQQETLLLEKIWHLPEPTVLVNNRTNRIIFGNESSAIPSYAEITLERWTNEFVENSSRWKGYEHFLERNMNSINKGESLTHCVYDALHLDGFPARFEATWKPAKWFRMSCRQVTMHGFTPLNDSCH